MLHFLLTKPKYIAIGLLFLLTVSSASLYYFLNQEGNVLGTVDCMVSPCSLPEEPVKISGFITSSSATLRFRVFPEKRIPSTDNWDTFARVDLVSCNNSNQYTYTNVPTNIQGYGDLDLSINNVPADDYKFFIKGYSHLNEEFNCYSVTGANQMLDLTPENKELLAGEVSSVYDDYINALDISVLVRKLFGNDYLTDLNQDGEVNSLDFSNQIYNLYKTGD